MHDLPDEILLLIFDQPSVSNETLFKVSRISRRFHYFCVPLLLLRYGIKNPSKQAKIVLTEDTKLQDSLSALQIALHVDEIDRLVCKFPSHATQMSVVIHGVRRLQRLINRIRLVRSVTLVFGGNQCYCCSSKGPQEGEWSSAMGDLLNAILEKSCEILILKGGRYLAHLYSFHRRRHSSARNLIKPFEAMRTFFRRSKEGPTGRIPKPLGVVKGDSWEFRRRNKGSAAPILTNLSPSARSISKMQSFTIQSMMFLMPPLLQWTISAMQFSNIKSLTLKDLSINRKCWPAIFRLISSAVPNLSELALSNIRWIDHSEMSQFLACLPNLTSLAVDRDIVHFSSVTRVQLPDFPKLIALHAPASWVFNLLSSQQRGLGCLESLCISYEIRGEGFPHWLRPCLKPTIPSLLCDHPRPLTVCLELTLGSRPGWRFFEDLNAATVDRPALMLASSISLIVNQEFMKNDMELWVVLPRWLALFPALRHLSLTGHNSTIDGMDVLDTMIEMVKSNKIPLEGMNINGKEVKFVKASTLR